MKLNILIFLAFLIHLADCTSARIRLAEKKADIARILAEKDKPRVVPLPKISDAEALKIFMKTNQSLEAFIMRKKYEIGKRLLNIINNMKLRNGKSTEPQAPTCEVETDYEKSFERASSYLKVYNEKGWQEIKRNLPTEQPFVKTKILLLAMNQENVQLVKDLFNSKLVEIGHHHYDYAIKLYQERGNENMETIIDLFAANNPELGTAVRMNKRLNLGFAMVNVVKMVVDNNYPMLERALDEGILKPNAEFPNQGSLLGLAVMHKCVRCVKILIDRGADVNAPILSDEMTKFDGFGDQMNPFGWTPLMVAAADGKIRIVKHLIESNKAFVSRTPAGLEDERFHARAVARMIDDKEVKYDILKSLKLNPIETEWLLKKTENKSFLNAIRENNLQLVDAFLLLRPESDIISSSGKLAISKSECQKQVKYLIFSELLNFNS